MSRSSPIRLLTAVLLPALVLTLVSCARGGGGEPSSAVQRAPSAGNGAHAVQAAALGAGAPAAPAAPAAAPPIPGTDPGIQHWFLLVDKAKIAFDNALRQAENQINTSSGSCQPLLTTANAILTALSSLRAVTNPAALRIADAVKKLMTTMVSVATLCINNDSGTKTALATGIQQQADTQALIDEILDGDA